MTPNWKPCWSAVNERQIVSALIVGYIYSHSRPSVANVHLFPWPTHEWWVNWLALLTISYHSPHRHFVRNCGINLPDEAQCLPYTRVDALVMDGPYPVKVILAWRHSTCTVRSKLIKVQTVCLKKIFFQHSFDCYWFVWVFIPVILRILQNPLSISTILHCILVLTNAEKFIQNKKRKRK